MQIGTLICYESVYAPLGRQAVQQGAQVLVNLIQRCLVRSHACPVSAPFFGRLSRCRKPRLSGTSDQHWSDVDDFDAQGREHAALPIYQRDTLVHTIQPLRLATLYTRFGDWFAQLCSIVALVLSLWRWRSMSQLVS